jgi:hypothetical protein
LPARTSPGADNYTAIPLEDRDLESNTGQGRKSEETKADHGRSTGWRARGGSRSQQGSQGRLNIRNTLVKWFVDCITLGALFNTTAFLVIMGALKGQSWEHIRSNMRNETLTIIVNGYKVWPLASIISFSLIPVERRILFFSFVGLCWNVYMTLVAARL